MRIGYPAADGFAKARFLLPLQACASIHVTPRGCVKN